MPPKLELSFTMRGYMSKEDTQSLQSLKHGPTRIIVPIKSGFIEGSGLKADILPGGSDWILMNPLTKISHIDVRTHARTSDGHGLYVRYSGIFRVDDAAGRVLAWEPDARTTAYSDHEWFIGPVIETNDPKYKWVESAFFVGEGRFVVDEKGSAVEYQIYRVV